MLENFQIFEKQNESLMDTRQSSKELFYSSPHNFYIEEYRKTVTLLILEANFLNNFNKSNIISVKAGNQISRYIFNGNQIY